jgi:hypothetical protein
MRFNDNEDNNSSSSYPLASSENSNEDENG